MYTAIVHFPQKLTHPNPGTDNVGRRRRGRRDEEAEQHLRPGKIVATEPFPVSRAQSDREECTQERSMKTTTTRSRSTTRRNDNNGEIKPKKATFHNVETIPKTKAMKICRGTKQAAFAFSALVDVRSECNHIIMSWSATFSGWKSSNLEPQHHHHQQQQQQQQQQRQESVRLRSNSPIDLARPPSFQTCSRSKTPHPEHYSFFGGWQPYPTPAGEWDGCAIKKEPANEPSRLRSTS
jgi:hypothetical protein